MRIIIAVIISTLVLLLLLPTGRSTAGESSVKQATNDVEYAEKAVRDSTSAALSVPFSVPIVRKYEQQQEQQSFDSLLAAYGNRKTLPKGYELQALIALSHYPQLRNIKIEFVVDDVGIPLSSRPFWGSLLRSASNRTYKVIVDTTMEGRREVLLLKNQPFNAQVGILGHELAHTVYYLDRSFFGIMSDALCQLTRCRINFERDTDKRLIEYGLGWQRYDHASFVRGNINLTEGAGGAYMPPLELLELIKANPIYAETAH